MHLVPLKYLCQVLGRRQLSVRIPHKMASSALILSLAVILLVAGSSAWPQDLGTGMMLAMGQLQQLADTGGGLRHEQSGEILGQPISGGFKLGMGEAMSQLPIGRRRRETQL